jgi:hypothetical protein
LAIALVASSLTMLIYAVDETANPRLRAAVDLGRYLKRLPRSTYRGGRSTVVVSDVP